MHLAILGTRGIPAEHGGFETFAEHLALYLVERGWQVTVYCQVEGHGPISTSDWNGVHRVVIPIAGSGAASTIKFDFESIRHFLKGGGKFALILGYNTAIFSVAMRFKHAINLINMDGLEWKRAKWGWWQRTWLWCNERAGCLLANHLIADHPMIEKHLLRQVRPGKVTMIPYGADQPDVQNVDVASLYGVAPREYVLLVARPEPENSVLEVVRAFSMANRGMKLVVLGRYDEKNEYHSLVKHAASDEVLFLGGVYQKERLFALRKNAALYVHGHQVGGTNPSLVEALAAGSAVMAHDNKFNQWVAGSNAAYFSSESDCACFFDRLLRDEETLESMRSASRVRFQARFTWQRILSDYEELLTKWSGRVGHHIGDRK